MRGWLGDLALGVRLSVGGGRTSWARLALTAVGIGLAVAVLLVAASVGTMSEQKSDRRAAVAVATEPVAGVSPTYFQDASTEFRGDRVRIMYVRGTAADSPRPAGLPELPKAGEMYASPALAELLRSDAGELLRPRLTEKVVGALDQSMVAMPGDLVAWIGADESMTAETTAMAAYGFGQEESTRDLDIATMTLLLIGSVVLLLPVFIFISSASRIAGAERDRRLAALRLVGSGSRQVRRIAAAESLTGAFVGLALGAVVFLVGRQFAAQIDLFGQRAYVSDVVPNPTLVLVIVLFIPAVSVLTALFALRRTIIEPLGVVRQAKPVRRRAWWRFGLIVLGVVLLTTQLGAEENTDTWAYVVVAGATLLLIGVPVLLPWLVERVAGRLRGGPSSWLLAIRRLQLDSGTSARVVGGVAVVLAGTIALQTVLLSVEGDVDLPGGSEEPLGAVEVTVDAERTPAVEADLSAAAGVESAHTVTSIGGYAGGKEDETFNVAIADCPALRALAELRNCTDGDVFLVRDQYMPAPDPGTALEWRKYPVKTGGDWDPSDYQVLGTWTVPEDARRIAQTTDARIYGSVIATPGALGGAVPDDGSRSTVIAGVSKNLSSDQLEGIRNAVADYRWQAYVFSYNTGPELTGDQQAFVTIRNALYAGSIFTLMLAGISLLVLALEHIRERRRQLAILTASGVPRGVLGRSLLWQVALPIGLGVAVALATGVGLAALMMRLTHEQLTIDWPGVIVLSAGAVCLCLLVSAMTMPFLRSATRLTSLRTE
jgi:ABC-type antimicrobial peptide transport system permease subunit